MGAPASRILLVDDSRAARAQVAASLEERGHVVVAHASGEAALSALEHEPFDLVLLDIVMKGMDGLEVLQKIRSTFDPVELPVLMTTARDESDEVVRALELGASDYVTKPFDLPVVIARIETHLRLRAGMNERRRPIQVASEGVVPPGTVIDERYEVVDILGSGGFAVVYRATQLSTGQPVAVKLMRAHRAAGGDVELRRFRRESRLIGELRHPHIVRLVDSGWLDVVASASVAAREAPDATSRTQTAATVAVRAPRDVPEPDDTGESGERAPEDLASLSRIPYLVMELLEGRSLASLLAERGRLPVDETVDLVLPVTSALWEAHKNGVVHRDLKPGNIFLAAERDGSLRPTVLDFGVAKLVTEPASELTDQGMVGTPGWWSPEQARGEDGLDARSDEYQLGAVVYQCVTGRKPFDAKGVKVVHEIAAGRFEPPSRVARDLPNGFEPVLMTMMSPDPAKRYPTLRAVARALLPFATKRGYQRWEPVFEEGNTVPPPG